MLTPATDQPGTAPAPSAGPFAGPRVGQTVGDLVRRAGPHLRSAAALGVGVAVVAVAGWLATRSGDARPPVEDLLPRVTEPAATPLPVAPNSSSAVSSAVDASVVETPALVVHVAGAVAAPGLYTLAGPARVADAVAAAGGLTAAADLDRVNLAALVADGERVYLPVLGEPDVPQVVAGSAPTPVTSLGGGTAAAPVDINRADAAALESLPGVGPATAAAIVAHRDTHGPFRTVEGLLDVRGIGPAKLDQVRPFVVVG